MHFIFELFVKSILKCDGLDALPPLQIYVLDFFFIFFKISINYEIIYIQISILNIITKFIIIY